ncbi:hypothetical protein [Phytoactinopolyspora mesophila]|uniref:Branched-chain amino acid ATP-binding cassette transporter C-terminal domain-containing protein n=1 Tax=Phytoactinopolyspora mesophila TaxID=2650750 RepID=A0A7K3MB15_9ACTN|nr:hypothetical protein [Phytoactinopolyspora mesophila]NDL60484.1 hypothetical protein [Phytoactinopolyspora mesophila]
MCDTPAPPAGRFRAADTGYVLDMGTLAHSGPAAQLLKDPRAVQAYLGMN